MNFQAKCTGFLIPVRDMEGRIQAAQIRLDRPAGKCKYIWFSSSERVLGASSGSPVHFVGDTHAKTITFTEGGLKGTITHCLTGETLICNAGASQSENIIRLLPALKANGVEEILSGYDMDLESNEHVRRGCLKILSAAREFGFHAKRRRWDPVNKGIDDHFWAEKLREILLGRLESEWPEETAPAIRQWVAANLRTYHFCSDTLVYLHFDKPMAYLAEKGRPTSRAGHSSSSWQKLTEIEKKEGSSRWTDVKPALCLTQPQKTGTAAGVDCLYPSVLQTAMHHIQAGEKTKNMVRRRNYR